MPYKTTDFDTVLMGTRLLTCHLAHLARRPGPNCLEDHVSEQMHGWGPPRPRAGTQSTSSPLSPLSFPPGGRGGELHLLLLLFADLSIQDLGPWSSRTATLKCRPDAKQSPFHVQVQCETNSGHTEVSPGYFWSPALVTVSALNVWYLNALFALTKRQIQSGSNTSQS